MSVRLHAITFDCLDPDTLSSFWSAFLHRPVERTPIPGIVTIPGSERHPMMVFQRVAAMETGGNRLHADFVTDDLAAESARLVRMGATVVREADENGARYTVFADPEANWFEVAESPVAH